jgi:hypothetical protein
VEAQKQARTGLRELLEARVAKAKESLALVHDKGCLCDWDHQHAGHEEAEHEEGDANAK